MQSATMLRIVCQFFSILVFFDSVRSKEIIWRFDSDISNPDNWIDGKLGVGCKGVHFSEANSAPVYIKELTTGEITLPRDGEVIMEKDGFVEFRDNKKCIKLKPLDYHYLEDPNSWYQSDNVAIPDKERIPCTDDDVIFPAKPSIHHYSSSFKVKSITTKTKDTLSLLKNFIQSSEKKCQDPYGCLCHDQTIACYQSKEEKPKCSNPVVPEESCHGICGAYLTYKPGKGPTIQEVKEKLKEYETDSYASRVRNYLGGDVVQIVFSEKEYRGKSVVEAEKFREYLQSTRAQNIQVYTSGEPLEGDHAVAIVLGSLVAVLVFFGGLVYFHGNQDVTNLFGRLNRSRGSIFNTSFFARFDTTDENLIIDGHSESGSILDIAKSFDNPMYGQSSSDHENPLYEVAKDIEE